MSEQRIKRLSGALFVACGIGGMVNFLLNPERVNGPAWMGQVASGGFVLTGLAIICQSLGLKRTFDWLVLGMLLSLFAVGSWVSLGTGIRVCDVGLWMVSSTAGGIACRSVFGIGAVTVGAFALWQFVRILRKQSAA